MLVRESSMSHCSRLEMLRDKVYAKQEDDQAKKLFENLICLNRIRNLSTHHFIDQIGSDLSSGEGLDQITAMLNKSTTFAKMFLKRLHSLHDALREGAIRNSLVEFMEYGEIEPEFDARVARSEIQRKLEEIEGILSR